MAKVTWLGEDQLHGPGLAGPSFTTWKGIKFPKDVPVDVTDQDIIRRAKGNVFFKVEGLPGRPKAVKKSDGDENTE